MRLDIFQSNPIAVREIQAYKVEIPRWLQWLDTVGTIIASCLICILLFLYWIVDRSQVPPDLFIYQLQRFSVSAYVQITVGIVYGCVLLRCIVAGVNVAARYKRHFQEDILLSGMSGRTIIWGQWYAALYQVRAWMVALGLVRITVIVVLTAEYQINAFNYYSKDIPYVFSVAQLPLAFLFTIILGCFEIWATVGLGIMAGSWVQNRLFSGIGAIILRSLPMMIFSWFPSMESPNGAWNMLVIRWYEYSWFAFVDGGTNALMRLATPTYGSYQLIGWFVARGLWPFLAAIHMLLFFGITSCLLIHFRLRWLGANSLDRSTQIFEHNPTSLKSIRYENVWVVTTAVIVSLTMLITWASTRRDAVSSGGAFFYNPQFLDWLQVILWIAIGLTTFRAIVAGVRYGHVYRDQLLETRPSVRTTLRLTMIVCHHLRGWWFALSITLVTAFGLLISEPLVNFYTTEIYKCISSLTPGVCGSIQPYFVWHPAQWVLGLIMTIALSGVIIFSNILVGINMGAVSRSPLRAITVVSLTRMILALAGFLPPNISVPEYWNGVFLMRWKHGSFMIFADNGISALLGIAEPSWHTGHLGGYTTVSFGLLSFVLVIYMLLGYGVLSWVIVRYWHRKRYITGSLRKTKNGVASKHQHGC